MAEPRKNQGVIDKLKAFFEKYFGIGGSVSFTEPEHELLSYDFIKQSKMSMVAEDSAPYGEDTNKSNIAFNGCQLIP